MAKLRTLAANSILGQIRNKRDRKIKKVRTKASRKTKQVKNITKKFNKNNLKSNLTGRPIIDSKEAKEIVKASVGLSKKPHTMVPLGNQKEV